MAMALVPSLVGKANSRVPPLHDYGLGGAALAPHPVPKTSHRTAPLLRARAPRRVSTGEASSSSPSSCGGSQARLSNKEATAATNASKAADTSRSPLRRSKPAAAVSGWLRETSSPTIATPQSASCSSEIAASGSPTSFDVFPGKRLKVAVDVDEVLGSFVECLNKYYHERFGERYEVSDYFEYCFRKVWECDQELSTEIVHDFFHSPHFAAGIEPIPGAYESLLHLSQHVDLEVVTSRQHIIQDETVAWIEAHYPGIFKDIHFGNHWAKDGKSLSKSEICKNIGAQCLIDDNPSYAIECAEAGINVLLYDWKMEYPWAKTPCGPTHEKIQRVSSWEDVSVALMTLSTSVQEL